MQFFGFALVAFHGDLTADLGIKLLWSMPALIVGTVVGLALFGKVNDLLFRRIILVMLFVSGLALI